MSVSTFDKEAIQTFYIFLCIILLGAGFIDLFFIHENPDYLITGIDYFLMIPIIFVGFSISFYIAFHIVSLFLQGLYTFFISDTRPSYLIIQRSAGTVCGPWPRHSEPTVPRLVRFLEFIGW